MNPNDNQSYTELDKELYLQTFKRMPVTFERGLGASLWDVEGNKYIDALAGIAVNSVGHSHPKVVKAIQDQAEKITHISNFFTSKPQVELSEKLVELSGLQRVFFTNSGAESVEGAIKIARKYAHAQGRGGTVISFDGSFHGRTLATIATGKPAMQKGFGPIPEGFEKVPFNDMDAVRKAVDNEVGAIIVEPIQGEGGINPAKKEFLQDLRAFCDKNSIVLIFDEIQCGVGRTGYWFAKDFYGVEPDIMTLAKALGGGVPIGAILSNEKVSEAMDYGDHGTTFGGNPLVCAAALASIEVMEDENLLRKAREKGNWIREQVKAMNVPSIKEVRGLGLMIGIEFDFPTKDLMLEMFKRKVIVNATAGNVLRIVPPLNIKQDELDELIAVLKASIQQISKEAKV